MRVYLLASFPTLSLHDSAPFDYAEWFQRCADHLSSSDLGELDATCSNPPTGTSAFAKQWAKAWNALDSINRRERLQRLPRQSDTPLPSPADAPDSLRHAALDAWNSADPLHREERLLKTLWDWIESHRRAHPYSMDDLIGYGLQLRLLERKASWEETAGQQQFDDHLDAFLDPLMGQLQTRDLSA